MVFTVSEGSNLYILIDCDSPYYFAQNIDHGIGELRSLIVKAAKMVYHLLIRLCDLQSTVLPTLHFYAEGWVICRDCASCLSLCSKRSLCYMKLECHALSLVS